jgi:hypothetical protein
VILYLDGAPVAAAVADGRGVLREVQGQPTAEPLAVALSDLEGVLEVRTADAEAD